MPAINASQELAVSQAGPQEREHAPLADDEVWWRDRQVWLHERGYMLRPRYRPGWIPSWKASKKRWAGCEDSLIPTWLQVMDATRISDGTMVVIKQVKTSKHQFEIEISGYFSSEARASDPRNHCVPIYEVLDDPYNEDIKLLVMPLLRPFDNPRFQTVGEAVEFFQQVFEGLQFMHEHRVAHRDCMDLNTMMDARPLYPKMYHPVVKDYNLEFTERASHYTRTKRPVKYYFIDFGISRKYDAGDECPLEPPIHGGDKSVPEFQKSNDPVNPFPTDIYYLGNMIRQEILKITTGLEFMRPLVTDMVQDEPSKRPMITEVAARFDVIRTTLPTRVLRSRLVYLDEDGLFRTYYSLRHFFRTIYYILARYPAVPSPKS